MRRRDVLRLSAGWTASVFVPPWRQPQSTPARPATSAVPGGAVRARVVVIGAGISGLGAARRLVDEYGLTGANEVVVLEGRDRLGGRIRTDTSLSAPVDLGASWIHGSAGNPISALANQFGVATTTVSGNTALFDVDGSPVPGGVQGITWQQYLNAYSTATAYIAGLAEDQPLEQSFEETGAGAGLTGQPRRVFERWLAEIETGLTAYNSQLSSFHHYMGSGFGGPDRLFPGGYSQIVEGVAQGLDVRLEHVVERVDHSGGEVLVHTDRGSFHADKCIVTLPLGVLKAGFVEFRPALPTGLQNAIARIGFGAAHKLAMDFPSQFWNAAATYISFISPQRQENMDWRNVSEYAGVPILSSWAYQDYARSLDALGAAGASARVMQDLRTIYGAGVPDPTAIVASDWNTSPFTMGSYSHAAVGASPADYDRFLVPVDDALFFAGEHTNSIYPSTVHGALLSGWNTAARVMGLAPAAAPIGPRSDGRRFGRRPRSRLR